jgi:chromosomal replication initiation ATPase DnaA
MCPPWSSVVEAREARGLLHAVAEIVRARHVTVFEACGRGRTANVVAARHAAWAHLRTLGFSYPEIGRLWGVEHSSVHKALRKR